MLVVSDKYQVSGYSSEGKNINFVINGRILTVGDTLYGMTITQIYHGGVLLEKDGFKKKISNVYERICKNNDSALSHIEYLKKCREETMSNLFCHTHTSENIFLNDFKYGF